MNMSIQMKNRRLRRIGSVLTMPRDRLPKFSLRWTPTGKRKRDQPKTTRRRTLMKELEEMGLTWGEAQTKAKDRVEWRCLTAALFHQGWRD